MGDNYFETDVMEAPPIDQTIIDSVDRLSTEIKEYKIRLYDIYVQQDGGKHKSNDLGAMYSYHAMLLETIGYWISLLDSQAQKEPSIGDSEEIAQMFDAITEHVKELRQASTDSRTLAYNVLFKKSVEHPFHFLRSELE